MTGFAQVRRSIPQGELVVTLKSVNHRSLDLHFHLPAQLDPHEPAIRAALKKRLSRGHIDVRVNFERAVNAEAIAVNERLLQAYAAAFRQAARTLGVAQEPDLNGMLRLPGLMTDAVIDLGEEFATLVLEAVNQAIDQLEEAREREGRELAKQLLRHNVAIRGAVVQLEELRDQAQPAIEARIRTRLEELLSMAGVDPQRVLQEAALIADRSNVEEELARLRVHSHQLETLLDSDGDVGKRLDFLLQEMNREANTILSKTSGIGEIGLKITDLALAAKSDIEKIREQALNIE
ncbi:MAG: YicC family protein [Bryobacteraceae bacterium]|nr:YicC family protein [Bryobacteraceae bacterium]